MRMIGFSSGAGGRNCNSDRMVKAILERSQAETEFVKLTDLTYSGCKACVHLCAGPQVCVLEDDLLPYYQKVKDADAVVLGSPVYFGTINATMMTFIDVVIKIMGTKTMYADINLIDDVDINYKEKKLMIDRKVIDHTRH